MLNRVKQLFRKRPPHTLHLERITRATPELRAIVAGYIEKQHAEAGEITNCDILAAAHLCMADKSDIVQWSRDIGEAGQAQAMAAVVELVNRE